jgi:alcohol dehydrogenase class IV
MKTIGVATNLRALGIKTSKDIDSLVANVNYERLKNNPRTLTPDGLRKLLAAMEEK